MDEKTQIHKRRRRRKRQKREQYIKIGIGLLALSVMIGVGLLAKSCNKAKKDSGKDTIETAAQPDRTAEKEREKRQQILTEADRIAAGYDYDGAISLIQSYQDYEAYQELTEAISGYETKKAECVPVNIEEVTHVFYHSLVVDPERAFANQENDRQAKGNNQWMATIDEFNKITQSMYDKGYVCLLYTSDAADE